METVGSIIDRLITVDMKMWYAQEDLYEIRNMSFEEFSDKYKNKYGMEFLWKSFQKSIDLNLQRNDLIDEIDKEISRQIEQGRGNVQRKHKTY